MSDDWDEEITGGFGGGGAIGRGFGRGRGGGGSDTNNNFGKKVGGFSGGDGPQMNGDVGGFGRKGFGGGAANDDSSTGGFGGGLGSRGGFGGGRGAASNRGGGFGAGRGDSVDSNGTGGFGSRGGGFGGKGRGGFGGGSSGGNEDTSNTRAGFGSQGGGGFGSKGGFGSNNDEPRGGGFRGGQSGGGFGGDKKPGSCFKCGEEGHMSRECPQGGSGGGGGGSRACFKCGEEGHMSRECPQGGGGGGGGGSRACFKCGEEGHMSRECPQGGGGGGGGGSRACFKCGEEGHMSRECPQGGGGGGGGGSRACFKCGEEGHMSRECPQGGGGGGGGGDKGCFKCKEEGHMARDCPNAESSDADKPREIYIPPPPPEDQESIFESIQKGINFDKYDNIGVECTGAGSIKTGLQSFTEANLYEKVQENIVKAKYDKPTPVQKFAIPVILNGHDLMACAQTGSGKTAAFLLPTLSKMIENGLEGSQFSEIQEPQAVVVGPTRELVTQIHREARKFSYNTMLRPVVVYGGTSVGHQLKSVEAGCHMVVGTPGRLMDFINRGKISLKKVKFLILDEADRMLDMGFEGEIRKLVEQLGMPPKTERQTLMFSATFPDQIQQLATDFLNNHVFITVGRVGGANTDVTQTIHEVTQYDKRDKLVAILNETGTDRTLVFVEQKRNADFLASYLSQNEFPTTSIHGDRLQREREEALRDFKLGKAPIMVATSVAARGLDIPGVKHVVNFDMPKDIDEYVHRIGRTGRCGNIGKATSFFDPMENKDLARPLVKILQDAQQEVPDWLEEAAQSSYGTGGFTNVGGRYGGRDARKGRSGGGGERSSGFDGNDGGGFGGSSGFGASSGGAAEEESWD